MHPACQWLATSIHAAGVMALGRKAVVHQLFFLMVRVRGCSTQARQRHMHRRSRAPRTLRPGACLSIYVCLVLLAYTADDTEAARAALERIKRSDGGSSGGGSRSREAEAPMNGSDVRAGLCYYGYEPELHHLAPTGMCDVRRYRKWGIPGGAVCSGAPNLAACPRPWE
jgi:hypothetical protein